MAQTKTPPFQDYLEEQLSRYKGVYVPVKTRFPIRVFIRRAATKALHPNPDDEFCDPKIGPNYGIISRYMEEIRDAQFHHDEPHFEEKLIVEKMRPDGYILVNGHHRWAAAYRTGLPSLPVKVVNLTHASDIRMMIENAKHDKRAALDLDEVVFVSDGDEAAEKQLPFPARRVYRERLRRGIPALFRCLKLHGYDIWVYTAKNYSMEYFRYMFKWYGVGIDNIITGVSRKDRLSEAEKKRLEALAANKYTHTLHLNRDSLLRVDSAGKSFEEFPLSGNPMTWSQEIMELVGRLDKNER